MVTPQGMDTKVEGVERAEKQAEPIQSQEKSTGKTYTEEDFQKAVSKGLESIQRQLDLRKAEADKYRAEADSHKSSTESLGLEIADLKQEIETITQSIEDPDIKTGILSKRALAEEKRQLTKAKAEAEAKLYEAEKLAWSARMAQRAESLHKETGIEVSELEECQTEEEMEVKALRAMLAKSKETKEEPPKFAGGGSGKGGDSWRDLSPEGKIAFGLRNKK